ncbi:MAG: hypothetical protein ACK6CU_01730 [Deltaproteobacteria bacterium]
MKVALDTLERIALGRCSACGACDLQLRPDDGWDRALAGPPSRWALALGQAPERWAELSASIAFLPEERARAMESRCHARVPFIALRAAAHQQRPRPGPSKKRRVDPG